MAAEGRNFPIQIPFLLDVQLTLYQVQSLKGYFWKCCLERIALRRSMSNGRVSLVAQDPSHLPYGVEVDFSLLPESIPVSSPEQV